MWPDVFRFALSWTNDWAAAEDLAQEAFARPWQRRDAVTWEGSVLPWLIVTTRRLAQDRFRSIRRRLGVRAARPATLDAAVADRWLDQRDALGALSPIERAALVLTTVEGQSYEKAAALLGTSPGALRVAESRARTKLEDAR